MSVTDETDVVCGWYRDPAGTGMLRWWDGGRWTDEFESPRPGGSALRPRDPDGVENPQPRV
jgi:hypothetical protein